MELQQIDYGDIIALGFDIEECNDSVYFNTYGYQYQIITKWLTKKIYIDWEKETRLAEMVRIDSRKERNIVQRMPIRDLKHLHELVKFFTGEKESTEYQRILAC